MKNEELMLKIENVSKVYRLGEIGGTTLRDELQRFKAKVFHKEDPTKKIGAKDYNKGEKFKALDNISFEVKKGERIGIIGHNGAGKSTLLKLISRVTGPTEGKIHLNGRVASMLEVGTGFHPELTGRENIYMNGAILGMTKKEIDAMMEDIIEFSEIRQFIDTPVKRFSSGMYVKLAFSVAAHLSSEIMIMDEVLAVGDISFQNKCLSKMKSVSLEEKRTILYVSHNMNTIKQLCNRVIVLYKGHIVFDGDVNEGINIYLGNKSIGGEKIISSNLDEAKRHADFRGKEARLTKAIFLNKSDLVFSNGENVVISVSVRSFTNIHNASILFVVRDSNREPLGSIVTESFDLEQGTDITHEFILNFDSISSGDFFLSLELISFKEDRSIYIYDNPDAYFPIKIDNLFAKGIGWGDYWGKIYFEDSKMVK